MNFFGYDLPFTYENFVIEKNNVMNFHGCILTKDILHGCDFNKEFDDRFFCYRDCTSKQFLKNTKIQKISLKLNANIYEIFLDANYYLVKKYVGHSWCDICKYYYYKKSCEICAARVIQKNCSNWIDKPITKDGKFGISARILKKYVDSLT